MKQEKQRAVEAIDAKAGLIHDVADQVWDFAELSLQEKKSAALYCEVLEKEGFTVERGICNIDTAFSGSFGSGRPVIGILAEYDALSGLSQEGGLLEQKERVAGGCGHGCGHNLLGVGAAAAAMALREEMEAGRYEIQLSDTAAAQVRTACLLKRSLKEIHALGGDYVSILTKGATA